MRFTRQLPPVTLRTNVTLRVTLEVMLVVSRRFHTKAHLSQTQCTAFCQSLPAVQKAPTKRESGQSHCLGRAETSLCFGCTHRVRFVRLSWSGLLIQHFSSTVSHRGQSGHGHNNNNSKPCNVTICQVAPDEILEVEKPRRV